MNANNIAIQWPKIKPRYLMNKNTGLTGLRQAKISLIRLRKHNTRLIGSLAETKIKLPKPDEYVEFSSD